MTGIPNGNSPEATGSGPEEFEALTVVVRSLQALTQAARVRVLSAAATFLGVSPAVTDSRVPIERGEPVRTLGTGGSFSADRSPSPKEFLFEKKPTTDVERIACLAYYLTHYRETPHFKTLDLSKLNTEAAQLKFSNAAFATDNAAKAGLLVPAGKGAKQLSVPGELYVQALPDRAAAKEALAHIKQRKRNRKGARQDSSESSEQESE